VQRIDLRHHLLLEWVCLDKVYLVPKLHVDGHVRKAHRVQLLRSIVVMVVVMVMMDFFGVFFAESLARSFDSVEIIVINVAVWSSISMGHISKLLPLFVAFETDT